MINSNPVKNCLKS